MQAKEGKFVQFCWRLDRDCGSKGVVLQIEISQVRKSQDLRGNCASQLLFGHSKIPKSSQQTEFRWKSSCKVILISIHTEILELSHFVELGWDPVGKDGRYAIVI